MKYANKILVGVFCCIVNLSITAQETITPNDLEPVYKVKTSPVKDQSKSGTCWSYATVSFLESELLRIHDKEFDLSEMYFVYYAYKQKADRYIRMHGHANFSPGGQAHDVTNLLEQYGAVTEKAYKGIQYDCKKHDHSQLHTLLEGFLNSVLEIENKLYGQWKEAYQCILKTYLGDVPVEFIYEGKTYTPKSFYNDVLKLDAKDYIEITSYIHHPYYTQFDLEIPDNWSHDNYYNVPLNKLIEIIEYSLENGYSIVWDGDVTEKGFRHKKGMATIDTGKKINKELRQKTFNTRASTDDHLMHLTGVYKDEDGNHYYEIKNSWNTGSNDFGGYLYMSEEYIKLKTVALMLNKNALSEEIKEKLGI